MGWGDPEFVDDFAIPKGDALYVPETNTWLLHPYDLLIQIGRGRLPLESKYNPGIKELERDRRRYPR